MSTHEGPPATVASPIAAQTEAAEIAGRIGHTVASPRACAPHGTPEATRNSGRDRAAARLDGSGRTGDTAGGGGATATAAAESAGDGIDDGPPPGYVTAEMIAEELARITGKNSIRPSTIRGMASRDQMPAPVDRKWGRRTLWDAAQIDNWLQEREARHVPAPTLRQIQRRLTELDDHARRTGNDTRLKEGVRDAHRRGLSYQQIADAIRVKNGDHHPTREAVRIRFRRYL